MDNATLVKMYGNSEKGVGAHKRYSPGECNGSKCTVMSEATDLDKISTSYAECSNLAMKMSMRPVARLT